MADPRICSRIGMVVAVPDRLKAWWKDFSNEEQQIITGKLGNIPSYMDVEPRPDLIEALLTFWKHQPSVFRFGDCELTPTLEEVAGLIKRPYLRQNMIYPTSWEGPRFLSELGLANNTALGGLKKGWIPLDYILDRFANLQGFHDHYHSFKGRNEQGWRKNRLRAFCLAVLGVVIFPLKDYRIHLRLGSVVDCLFKPVGATLTLVPMIIAELHRALSGVCRGSKFFEGSNLLLQVWAIEHLHSPALIESLKVDNCFSNRPEQIAKRFNKSRCALPIGFQEWVDFLSSHSEGDLTWDFAWLNQDLALVTDTDYLFLIGLRCIRPYSTARVLRQLQRKQVIPKMDPEREQQMQIVKDDYKFEVPEKGRYEKIWLGLKAQGKETLMGKSQPTCSDDYRVWFRKKIPKGVSRPLPIHKEKEIVREEEHPLGEASELEIQVLVQQKDLGMQAAKIQSLQDMIGQTGHVPGPSISESQAQERIEELTQQLALAQAQVSRFGELQATFKEQSIELKRAQIREQENNLTSRQERGKRQGLASKCQGLASESADSKKQHASDVFKLRTKDAPQSEQLEDLKDRVHRMVVESKESKRREAILQKEIATHRAILEAKEHSLQEKQAGFQQDLDNAQAQLVQKNGQIQQMRLRLREHEAGEVHKQQQTEIRRQDALISTLYDRFSGMRAHSKRVQSDISVNVLKAAISINPSRDVSEEETTVIRVERARMLSAIEGLRRAARSNSGIHLPGEVPEPAPAPAAEPVVDIESDPEEDPMEE